MSETRQPRTGANAGAPSSLGRRSFLLAAAGTGAAGVAVVAGVTPTGNAPEEALSEPDGRGAGYRETAHVARYYRSTRL